MRTDNIRNLFQYSKSSPEGDTLPDVTSEDLSLDAIKQSTTESEDETISPSTIPVSSTPTPGWGFGHSQVRFGILLNNIQYIPLGDISRSESRN